jgi:hypothetical protein
VQEALQRELPQTGEAAFDVSDLEAVVERLVRISIGDPARRAIGVQEAEPDRDLE